MSEFTIEAPVGFLSDGSPAANRVNDVKVVQFLLNAIPVSEGAPDFLLDVDGIVGSITNDAIGGFQQFQFGFMDHLVEPGKITIQRMNQVQQAVPAGVTVANEELRSWATRRTPQWNFTRAHVALANLAGGFTFSSDSQALLPPNYRANLVKAFSTILNPGASSPGSWGISPFDFYHCHVMVPAATATSADQDLVIRRQGVDTKVEQFRQQASGTSGATATITTAAQAQVFQQLLRTVLPQARQLAADAALRPGVRIEYHSFEGSGTDRPAGMQSNDPRRYWRSRALTPQPVVEPSELTTPQALGTHLELSGFGFLLDQQRVVHVVPGSRLSLSAPTGLPEADLI
jgi:hypothetical protein